MSGAEARGGQGWGGAAVPRPAGDGVAEGPPLGGRSWLLTSGGPPPPPSSAAWLQSTVTRLDGAGAGLGRSGRARSQLEHEKVFVGGPCGAARISPFVMKQEPSWFFLAWKLRRSRSVRIGHGEGSIS